MQVLSLTNTSKLAEIAMLIWSIWKARNIMVWHEKYTPVNEVIRTAQVTLDQWLDAQSKILKASIGVLYPMDGQEHWTTPEENKLKVNVDAALFDRENRFGYGCVARDSTWMLVEVKVGSVVGKTTAMIAEAVGFKEALSWIKRN